MTANHVTGPLSTAWLPLDDPIRVMRQRGDCYRLLLDGATDHAMMLLDPLGRIAMCSTGAERLLGVEERDVLGESFACFFACPSRQNRLLVRMLRKARISNRASLDQWYVHSDGSRFWGSGTLTPVGDAKLAGYAVVFRDTTHEKSGRDALRKSERRQRRLAAKLEDLSRRRDRFIAVLSHEIRNPLAPILTALEVMRHDRTESHVQRQARNVIERQVQQLAHLVDDLLETSRLTAGKLRLRREQVDLRVVIERVVESARPFIDQRRHVLTVSLPEDPVWLHADPIRLEQLFLNLLNNAAKYTEDHGHIGVSAESQGEQAVVQVTDTGQGIPANMLEEIFEMFTQVDGSLDQSRGGMGIGLTLVKNLAEMHGGSVRADSQGPGKGSQFTVGLPVMLQPVAEPPPRPPEERPSTAKLRILVADDSRDASKMLGMVLEKLGHQICIAHDGVEAFDTAAAFRPDIVLMDIGMPRQDGYETARQIRSQPWGNPMLLVALTGWGREEDKRRTGAAGFDHHLTKPVRLPDLQALISAHGHDARA